MVKFEHQNEKRAYILDSSEMPQACISITAILNKVGSGELLVGVSNDGYIKGVSKSVQKIMDDLFNEIQTSISPKIYPLICFDSKNNIVRVEFQGTNKPYSYKHEYYIRSYDENRKLDYDSLMNEISFLNQSTFFETIKSSESTKDVDDILIKNTCARIGIKTNRRSIKETLKSLSLLQDGCLNSAGRYLFSKKKPLDIQITSYSDLQKKRVSRTDLIKGNIFDLLDKIPKYIKEEQIKEKTHKQVPLEIIKETLVFSFLNSSYMKNEQYVIQISPYEVSFKFPGTLFYLKNIEEYIGGKCSIQNRNTIISNVMNLAGFSSDSNDCLFNIDKICNEKKILYSSLCSEKNLTITFFRYDNKIKTVTLEQAVLSLLVSRPMIKADGLAKKLNVSRRTIQSSIKKLKESNLITRKGSNKNGYWIVNK